MSAAVETSLPALGRYKYRAQDGREHELFAHALSSVDRSPVVVFRTTGSPPAVAYVTSLEWWTKNMEYVGPAADPAGEMHDVPGTPEHVRHRHGDGGLYLVTGSAFSAMAGSEGDPLVLYEHLWPFERHLWARPLKEWYSRFTPMSDEEFAAATAGNRQQAQDVISARRKARKG